MAEIDDPLPACELGLEDGLVLPEKTCGILDSDDLELMPVDLLLDGQLSLDEKLEFKADSPTADRTPADLSNQEKISYFQGLTKMVYFKFANCPECGKKNLLFLLADLKEPLCKPCLEKSTGEDVLALVKTPWKLPCLEREVRGSEIDHKNDRIEVENVQLDHLLEGHQEKLNRILAKMTTCFQLCKSQVDLDSKVLAVRILGETIENLVRLNSILKFHSIQAKLEVMDPHEKQFFKNELSKTIGPLDGKVPNIGGLGIHHSAISRRGSEAEGISLAKIFPVRRSSFFELDESGVRPYYLGKRCHKKSDIDLDVLQDTEHAETSRLNICSQLHF